MLAIRCWLVIILLALVTACAKPQPELESLQGRTMGTTYTVKFVNSAGLDAATLQQDIDQALVEVNRQMSTYDPDSELSQFNRMQAAQAFAFSSGAMMVLEEAKRLGKLTGGVLDVTVGPLVNLWGFGPNGRPEQVPTQQDIERVRQRTGLDLLELESNQAIKRHPELYVDLSTIAKGYGVDVVAELLERRDIYNYLVEIGGEMRLSGHKHHQQPWRVAIEKPVSEERAVAQIISVGDNAVATSGDYRNYYEQDGVRYSHIIDPLTARPIQHNLVSVTVVHPSAMTADGLATAINVMGLERGLAFAREQNLPVFLISKEKGGYTSYNTAEFKPYLQ
ncbi:FAD:protein FMN transferase [Saliniradius amylolyticus]|uniref:FAD:protein FMN transferase n=1 Tax=Saliniradius amylolyticus TaxID=2183582 RepID=A0A2S2DZZ4_9ALTE|nr:FAD:protein FMN transferase [Saliniradius amylolyticus]